MSRTLYDLAGADPGLRFSPYCWRTKLALAHKKLRFETVPWRFTEKEAIAFAGSSQVPVLVDGEAVLHDSQAIAEYLDAQYPDEAALFGDEASRGLTRFVKHWAEEVLHPAIVPVVLPDIFKLLDPKDQRYFRQSREARLGCTIEALAARREAAMAAFHAVLPPLRGTLRAQKFLAGATPCYADHIVFGALQWARLTSSTVLLEADDPISRWMEAVLAHYGHLGLILLVAYL